MSKCKNCGKSGIFLTVSKKSLCNICAPIVEMDLQNRGRIYNDCIRLIDESENPDVVYSRIHLAKEIITIFHQYEIKGIETISPEPSILLKKFEIQEDDFLLDTFIKAQKTLEIKVLNLKTNSAKINQIHKFIDKINEYIPKVKNPDPLIKLRQESETQLNIIPDAIENKIKQNKKHQEEMQQSNEIIIKEIHRAKLLFMEESSKNRVGSLGEIRIKIMLGGESQVEFIGPDEPSIIYKDLPINKPIDPSIIERPSYYPTYAGLSPEQRWIYLNWLEDITEEVNIGYVFIYYYGLERHLLIGDFDTAYQEILLLRKIHDNKSFESYSYNALLFSSAYRNRLDIAEQIMENESKNGIDNIDLLFKYRFEKDISVNDFMSLAKKIKGVNLRYIKALPDRYKAALTKIFFDMYDSAEYPIYSLYRIDEIPMENTIAFANTSFPSTLRSPNFPNFLNHTPFLVECSNIFSKAHDLVKEDLIKERLIKE